MTRHIYHWAATGYDPLNRFPNGIQIFFDYDASLVTVQLTLQHLLGYMPHVADQFPYGAFLPDATLDQTTMLWTLDKPLHVQTQLMGTQVLPAGTTVQHHLRRELLFSPANQ